MPPRSTSPRTTPATESDIEAGDVDPDGVEWTEIKVPFVPGREFSDVEPGDAPDPGMWDVVRVPSDDEPPAVVERAEATPLDQLSNS